MASPVGPTPGSDGRRATPRGNGGRPRRVVEPCWSPGRPKEDESERHTRAQSHRGREKIKGARRARAGPREEKKRESSLIPIPIPSHPPPRRSRAAASQSAAAAHVKDAGEVAADAQADPGVLRHQGIRRRHPP